MQHYMMRLFTFFPLLITPNLVTSTTPPNPEEELLATIVIKTLFEHEETYRYFLPYDRALVKSVAPHALRLAFHKNMGKSDGCVDMTNKFSNGLQNFTAKVEENHMFYQKMYQAHLFIEVFIGM